MIKKAPWDRGAPSLAPPTPHRILQEKRFFFLATWAIVFALSRVYDRSLFTGLLTNVINTKVRAAKYFASVISGQQDRAEENRQRQSKGARRCSF